MNYKLIASILLITFCTACHDIIEKDITKQNITINSPRDSSVLSNYNVLFWWEPNDYIFNYRIQIVNPSFSNPVNLMVDSVISTNKLNYTLFPGNYEVRIRGENNTGNTSYYYRSFKVDSTYDLTGQSFTVNIPEDNLFCNASGITFGWNNFPFADQYTYNLYKSGSLIKSKTTSSTSLVDTILQEGIYTWNVFGTNSANSTSTNASDNRVITIDTTKPIASILVSPSNNALTNNPVLLTWTRSSIDVVLDSVLISTSASFSTIDFRLGVSDTFYSFTGVSSTDYYWKLFSIDKAGNPSTAYSATRKFRVN